METIEKEKKGGLSSFRLEHLDLDPKFDEKSFELPSPPEGAEDVSAAMSALTDPGVTQTLRSGLYTWIGRHVADESIPWDSENRAHVRRVLENFHADRIGRQSEAKITALRQQIEELGTHLRDRFARLAGSEGGERDELEAMIEKRRENLFDSLQERIGTLSSELGIEEQAVPDEELRSSLLEIEREAVRTAFERAVQDPLIELFDDQIEKARSGG